MWDLHSLKKKNDEWVERMRKNWRGAVRIEKPEDLDQLYPYPYFDPEVERKVFFASNLGELLPVPEQYVKKHLKVYLENNGAFALSLYSASRYEVQLVIWFG